MGNWKTRLIEVTEGRRAAIHRIPAVCFYWFRMGFRSVSLKRYISRTKESPASDLLPARSRRRTGNHFASANGIADLCERQRIGSWIGRQHRQITLLSDGDTTLVIRNVKPLRRSCRQHRENVAIGESRCSLRCYIGQKDGIFRENKNSARHSKSIVIFTTCKSRDDRNKGSQNSR